jgi:LPS O-antigen subunit length determinant protein (WzzB/FepE family)
LLNAGGNAGEQAYQYSMRAQCKIAKPIQAIQNAIQYAPTRGIVRRTYQKQTASILQVINETNQVSTLQYGEDAPSFK